MLTQTDHDYQGALCGNFYNPKDTTSFWTSWDEFKENWSGFREASIENYDDTYHFLFRFDIHEKEKGRYSLELCNMLQRKGIYCFIVVQNISQEELDGEIKDWLTKRKEYMLSLWKEI